MTHSRPFLVDDKSMMHACRRVAHRHEVPSCALLNCPFARLVEQDTRTVSGRCFPLTCHLSCATAIHIGWAQRGSVTGVVSQELEIVENFLSIEQVSFADRPAPRDQGFQHQRYMVLR